VLRRLVTALGIDYTQWRALLGAYITLEYGALFGADGPEAAGRAWLQVFGLCAFLGMLSAESALFVWNLSDTFTAATLAVSIIAIVVGTWTLMLASTIFVPDDYLVIASHPVSARTYLAARTTGLLVHTAEATVISGFLPTLAFLTRSGGSTAQALGAAVAIAVTSIASAVGVIVVYGWLMELLGAARMRRVLLYSQASAFLILLGALMALWFWLVDLGDLGLSVSVKDVILPRTAAVLLFPGTWFGAYVEIARVGTTPLTLLAAGNSVLLVLALVAWLRSRTSVGYARRIAEMTIDRTAPLAAPDPAWRLMTRERRAVFVLFRHQLRADLHTQVNVVMTALMGALLLGLMMWTMDSTDAPLVDPFRASGAVIQRSSWYGDTLGTFMAAMFMPAFMWQSMVTSTTAKAAWPFFTTGADRVRLATATRDMAAVLSLLPLLATVGGYCAHVFGNTGHALMYTLFLGALGYIQLQFITLIRPVLPFSQPAEPGRSRTFPYGWRTMVANLIVMMLWRMLMPICFRTRIATLIAAAGLVCAGVALNYVAERRLRRFQFAYWG